MSTTQQTQEHRAQVAGFQAVKEATIKEALMVKHRIKRLTIHPVAWCDNVSLTSSAGSALHGMSLLQPVALQNGAAGKPFGCMLWHSQTTKRTDRYMYTVQESGLQHP